MALRKPLTSVNRWQAEFLLISNLCLWDWQHPEILVSIVYFRVHVVLALVGLHRKKGQNILKDFDDHYDEARYVGDC